MYTLKMSRENIPLTSDEIPKMAKACKFAARTLEHVGGFVRAGITTEELDKIVNDYVLTNGAKSATIGYYGWKWASCTSINDVICHGVPDKTVLKEGDIINVDVTVIVDGFFGDTSKTFTVGKVSPSAQKITDAAYNAMMKGIEAIGENATTGDIGFETQKFTTRQGFYTVKEIGGHGIGKSFHLDPFVPAFGKKGRGDRLIPNTCITVEPMINENNCEVVEIDVPGSTIKAYKTSDGCLSAQFEHTVLITPSGCEILTVP